MPAGDTAERALRRLVTARPGERLPGERQLGDQLRVGRSRLRQLLAGLAHEGLVVRRHGSGTYAAGAVDGRSLRAVTLLIDDGFKLGQDPWCATVVEHLQRSVEAVGARLTLAASDGEARPATLG